MSKHTPPQAVENKPEAQENQTQADKPTGFLGLVERVGNKLPDPFWLFVILAGVVAVSSWIGNRVGMSAVDPATGDTIEVTNLLTSEGISQMVTEAVANFTSFPPLGVIIIVMLGVAVAEYAGLISALVRAMVSRVGPRMLTFAVALAGVTGSIASDAVYVILIPLGAMAFHAVGRSPIVGAMVAFAASSAGFNASLVPNITDVLLGGLSTSAAQIVDESYEVNPLANYFFVVPSSIVLALIITVVTEFFINKKVKQLVNHDEIDTSSLTLSDDENEDPEDAIKLKPAEVKGLWATLVASVVFLGIYFALLLIPGSPLAHEDGAMESPLIRSVAVPIALMFFVLGTVYGLVVGSITKAADIPEFMAKGLKTLIPMLVLFFAVSQFLAWFDWSNIGRWTSIKGSELLQKWDLPILVTFLGFVLMVAVLNLLITSGSAQWALMAPVIVPMMMYIGVSPEVTQMLYRIGDSPTNIITPMSPYFALALTFLQRYYKKAGMGTLMSMALPYSMAMMFGWFVFFVIWYLIGIPLGPGTPMDYQLPQ